MLVGHKAVVIKRDRAQLSPVRPGGGCSGGGGGGYYAPSKDCEKVSLQVPARFLCYSVHHSV